MTAVGIGGDDLTQINARLDCCRYPPNGTAAGPAMLALTLAAWPDPLQQVAQMTTADIRAAMEDPEFRLAAEFQPASRADWVKLVSTLLKGASFEEKLVSSTYGGLYIEPLYSGKRDAEPVPARAPGMPWQILQRVDHPNAAAANEQVRHDLSNGATGLWVALAGSTGANGYGIDLSEAALDAVFNGIEFDGGFPIELDSGAKGINAARALQSLLRNRAISPALVDLRFGFDPLSAIAIDGGSSRPWKELGPELAGSVRDLVREGFRGPFAVADGRPVHAAAGSEAQELAFALSSALAYLRSFESAGIRLEEARRMIFFRLAADADELLTIAKFRALRRLWARIEASCGLETESAFVSAETAWRMLTTRDPWVNILRATTAVFAAGVGGANAISVLPFTAALGLADASARRIARNTQLILIEEANLAKVADPAAGSGAIEDLTDQLCRIAWAQVQETESCGGLVEALEREFIQRQVESVRLEREKAVALRKDALTGTSRFPDLEEHLVSVLNIAPRREPPSALSAFAPLERLRLSEPYERLRERSDRLLAETGARPKVFLANLGPLAAFNERSTWAKNLFAAGGIEAIINDGFATTQPGAGCHTDLDAMIAAFRASRARLACIASSDEIYVSEGESAAQALANAGARHTYLAGQPRAVEAKLRNSGVGTFLYIGCDVLAILKTAFAILGLDDSAPQERGKRRQ
jgi:methylmalonyl-CoA mutase